MTVRAILDSKGHQITTVSPDSKLSDAIKTLGQRKIGRRRHHHAVIAAQLEQTYREALAQ